MTFLRTFVTSGGDEEDDAAFSTAPPSKHSKVKFTRSHPCTEKNDSKVIMPFGETARQG